MLTIPAVRGYRLVGLAGSVALTLAGLSAGALPVAGDIGWLLDSTELRSHPKAGLLCAYFGVTLLVAAWWWLGREIRRPNPPEVRSLLVTLALWAAPLLLGPPLFSRDVYSYLAQGAMVDKNINVYEFGVASLGGPIAAEVPAAWQHTPTPYGPVFLALVALVARMFHAEVIAGVLGMRLVALAGIAAVAALLPYLARRCGVDPVAALWLGVLNPLVLLHLVAGAHNDAIMLGLLVAGLASAFSRRFLFAAVLVALAALSRHLPLSV